MNFPAELSLRSCRSEGGRGRQKGRGREGRDECHFHSPFSEPHITAFRNAIFCFMRFAGEKKEKGEGGGGLNG